MISIFLRAAAAWAAVQALLLGPIIFLILLVAVKGNRRGALLAVAAIAAAALGTGLLLGGPLAVLIVQRSGLGRGGACACGLAGGAAVGEVELLLFLYPSKKWSLFRKLAPMFGVAGAFAGLVAVAAAT